MKIITYNIEKNQIKKPDYDIFITKCFDFADRIPKHRFYTKFIMYTTDVDTHS